MHPGSRVLWGCSAQPAVLPPSPQLCQNGGLAVLSSVGETEKWGGWGTAVKLFLVKNPLVIKRETVRHSDATASSFIVAKVRGEVFAHFHAAAVKHQSSLRNWLFGPPWRKRDVKENYEHALEFALHLSHLFPSRWVWTFRVRLVLPSPTACLIIPRVSVALFPRFAQNCILFLRQIWREIVSGQIHDST
jgi:hypothetical protein